MLQFCQYLVDDEVVSSHPANLQNVKNSITVDTLMIGAGVVLLIPMVLMILEPILEWVTTMTIIFILDILYMLLL